MVDLRNDTEKIEKFIVAGLEKFSEEVQNPVMMGVYSCPWASWISLNFKITYSLDGRSYYCPDFDFVEYDFMEFKNWEEEYHGAEGTWIINDSNVYNSTHDDGSERLNKFFFGYLKDVLIGLNNKHKLPSTLLQMLDSNCCEKVI